MGSGEDRTVSVFGANDTRRGDEAYETARAAGRTLAELGYGLANGGYGGAMEASARGAREAGGEVVGVLCTLWPLEPNEHLTRTVTTSTLYERLDRLIELGSAGYVALRGGTGTLVEVALVWELLCKKLLSPRPLVCVGRFWRPMIEMMSSVRPASAETIACIESPRELEQFFPRARRG